MPGSKLRLTSIIGMVSALVFVTAFAAYQSRRTDEGVATPGIGCETRSQIRIFFSDIPNYASRDDRVLLDEKSPGNLKRTFRLPSNLAISPGKYEVRTISSDHHYNHRSDAPDQDVQNQPNEEYYITIDDQRTATHSSDFTDYYDWRGADGELLQDDDNNVDTVPSVVRDSWQGESLGIIDVSRTTKKVIVEHADVYDDFTPRWNSVIPSALILDCQETGQPILEVEKSVDANNDDQFDTDVEAAQLGEDVRWKVVGRNVGAVADEAATIHSCAPEGTTFVPGSEQVVGGAEGGALTQDGSCITWVGSLDPDETVEITFDVSVDDIDVCDASDGTVDGRCSCDAVIFSDTTQTTKAQPADIDVAAIVELASELSVVKKVDGSDENRTLSDDAEQITPDGSQVIWEITAANAGPGNVPNARVVDKYPSGISIGGASASHGDVTIDGSTIVWNGRLNANEDVVIDVQSSVDDVAAFNECESSDVPGNSAGDGLCTNRAFVGKAESGTSDGFNGSTSHDDAEIYAVFAPSLTIKKYVDGVDDDAIFSDEIAEEIATQTDFSWRVVGCNAGDAIESSARIVDVIPAGVNLKDDATQIRVTGPAAASGEVRVIDAAEGDRPAVVWNGSLAIGDCIEIEYTTDVSDETDFEACTEFSATNDDSCGVSAYIGAATSDSAVSVDPLTRSSDPAFVVAHFMSELMIQKFVDGNDDGSFDDVLEEVTLNQNFDWKVVATNTGTGAERSARITDALPAGVELVSAEANQVAISEAGGASTSMVNIVDLNGAQVIVWDGSLPVDARVELVFAARVVDVEALENCIATTGGDYCRNSAQVGQRGTGSSVDIVGDVAMDSADIFAVLSGELAISKEVDVDGDGSWSELETIAYDSWFDWRISISNQGAADVTDAAVLDVFPEGVIIDQLTSQPTIGTAQLGAGEQRNRLFWSVPSFGVGETAEFIVRAKIADLASFNRCDQGQVDGDQDELCTNYAFVGTGTDPDNFADVDRDKAQVDVVRQADVYIVKTDDTTDNEGGRGDFRPVTTDGEVFEWVVEFGNRGNGLAEDVTVTDPLPDGVEYVSHQINNGRGTSSFDDTTRRITWNGSIEPGEVIKLIMSVRFNNEADFKRCDLADGIEDARCRNTARLSYQDEVLEDQGFVLSGSGSPVIELEKTVDADADGSFSEVENIASEGDIAAWRVEITNAGTAPTGDIIMIDPIVAGLELVPNTIREIEGASLGVAQHSDGHIEWSGNLDVDEKVVIEFQTRVASALKFSECNFSDGDSSDERCTNDARVAFTPEGSAIATNTAALTTSLQVILAYTGSRGDIPVAVGVFVAIAAVLATFVAYRNSEKPSDYDKRSGPPPKIVYPED